LNICIIDEHFVNSSVLESASLQLGPSHN